jgi:serine/threonine protein kinase
MGALIKQKDLRAGKYIIECKEVISQKDKKYIVYEYCPYNSLKEIVKKGHQLTIKNIYEITYQLIQVLKLIHFDLIQSEEDFYKFSLKF